LCIISSIYSIVSDIHSKYISVRVCKRFSCVIYSAGTLYKRIKKRVISGFCRKVDDISDLPGYYAADSGNSLTHSNNILMQTVQLGYSIYLDLKAKLPSAYATSPSVTFFF
jgi:hypothetical protein